MSEFSGLALQAHLFWRRNNREWNKCSSNGNTHCAF